MATESLIVDADGHVMEPGDLWTERMDHARWGDWIPRKVVEDEIYEVVYTGGVERGGGGAAGPDGGCRRDDRGAVLRPPAELAGAGRTRPARAHRRHGRRRHRRRGALPIASDVLRAVRPDPGVGRHRLRDRLHPRVQRLDRRVLLGVPGPTLRDGGSPAPRHSPRHHGGATGSVRARVARRLHPTVGLRPGPRRARSPAQPFRVRPVLGRVPGARRAGRLPSRRARRHPGRVASSGSSPTART